MIMKWIFGVDKYEMAMHKLKVLIAHRDQDDMIDSIHNTINNFLNSGPMMHKGMNFRT